jgi:hypothetical protein
VMCVWKNYSFAESKKLACIICHRKRLCGAITTIVRTQKTQSARAIGRAPTQIPTEAVHKGATMPVRDSVLPQNTQTGRFQQITPNLKPTAPCALQPDKISHAASHARNKGNMVSIPEKYVDQIGWNKCRKLDTMKGEWERRTFVSTKRWRVVNVCGLQAGCEPDRLPM